MITLPQKDEILDVVKKLEFGFELEVEDARERVKKLNSRNPT